VRRHFIYLTNTRLVSMVASGKAITARREFAVSGAGAEEFSRYLATLKRVPAHVFTDLAEEDFRLDTIPHVGAGDREAIFNRRLTQVYRNTPFRYAVLQGRDSEGRRDDHVLYTAVTNPEILSVWLDMIERLKVPLVGIYSCALFSGALLKELDLEFPHTLLVTFSPGEALRQTYFRAEDFKFSRLTPVDLEEGQTLGAMVAEETTRTWQYLDSLRHFGADDRLEVCLLIHSRDRPLIEPHLRGFAQIQYRVLDMGEVSAKLGLKPAPLASSAEEVMVHLFLLRPRENHFASSEQRRHETLRATRRVLSLISLGVLATSVVWGGFNLTRVFQGSEVDQRVTREINQLNREYEEINRSLPTLGVAGLAMRDTVAFYNASIKSFPSITDFLRPLSGVLQAYPQVRLSQLTWQATDDPKVTPIISPTPSRLAPSVKALPKTGEPPVVSPQEDTTNPPFAGGRYEIAHLEATVRVSGNDFRGAVDQVEKLAEDIGRLPGFRASVVDSPLDVRSSLGLRGHHTEREPEAMEPRFVLRIVRDRGEQP
jgi:hypothetical protein